MPVYDRGYALSAAGGPQEIYDLLLKNGHVVDPANSRSGNMDVAVIGGRIAHVAPGLPASPLPRGGPTDEILQWSLTAIVAAARA